MTEPISGRAAHDLPRTPPSVTLESNAVTISGVSPSILKTRAGSSNSSSKWAKFDFSMSQRDPSVTEARGVQSATSPTPWCHSPDATPCSHRSPKFGPHVGVVGGSAVRVRSAATVGVVAMSQGSQLRVGTTNLAAVNAMHNANAFVERCASDTSSEALPLRRREAEGCWSDHAKRLALWPSGWSSKFALAERH